jgi:hypothetical protein
MLQGQPNMLNQVTSLLKSCVPASIRFEIRQKKAQFKHFFAVLRFWKWENHQFVTGEAHLTSVVYKGRPENKALLMALLGANTETSSQTSASDHQVYVTEHPMRDAICVPFALITIVKLGRPIEAILASYSKSLRRSINAERSNYRYQAIDGIDKIEALESAMLKPYAIARHDIGAAQLQPGLVQKFAQKAHGRLDLLLLGDEEVGCHLGNPYTCKGKRYWHVNRLGYPQTVFSDYKRWGEVNSINLHLALEAAIENGYDYCDYGVSLAKPGHGLIEWKRRRRGFLATHDNFNYFYMKLPKTGGAQFLWDSPVFGVEDGKPTLHLGIPEGKTDEELLARYHEMGYAGLYKVYLDCVKAPSSQFIDSIRALYADQDPQPLIISYLVG